MKTLHASELISLIKKQKLTNVIDVVTCIGPETDLVLLLDGLRQLKDPNVRISGIMEAIFTVICFQYPDKAVEYLRNINSEFGLEEILDSPAEVDLNIACNYEKDTANNLVTGMKYKILRDFIYEVCIPKFKKFFENKTVLVLDIISIKIFKNLLFKENILNNDNYFEYIPYSNNQFINLIKVFHHDRSITSERERVVNSMKAWMEQFKKINLMICSKSGMFYSIPEQSIYPNIEVNLRIRPSNILEKSPKDKKGLIYGISQLIVTMFLVYDKKTHTYTLKCDNISVDNLTIQRYSDDKRCKSNGVYINDFVKFYGRGLKKLINSFIIENPSAFIIPAPQLVVVSKDKPLLSQI